MKTDYTRMSDARLADTIKNSSNKSHSEGAFTELYNRYSSKVHTYCLGMVRHREHGEDIFQETFIKIYTALKKEFEPVNVCGYLMTIARNSRL